MRTKHFFTLCAVMGGFAAAGFAATGCGSNGTTGGNGGAGGAGSTSATSASHSTSHTTSISSVTSSSSGGAENPTCDKASDLALNGKDVPGSLPDPANDFRWYKFDGKKGDPMLIFTTAKTGMDKFDTSYLDTVVTLYSGDCNNQVQVAQNDDPNPRFTNDGTILTVLPADGTYYVRVGECNGLFGAQQCASAAGIMTHEFTVGAGVLDFTVKSNVKEAAEPNDTVANATDMTMKYEPGMNPGSYYVTNVFGNFDTMTDVDVYKVNMPMDISIDPATERSIGYFYPQGSTSDNDGSTIGIGKVWIVDPKDPNKSVASIDLAAAEGTREIAPPLKLATDYYLFVQRGMGMGGMNDFYIMRHNGGGSNPIEKADATNGDVATPETLTAPAGQPSAFFIDGDISKAGDLDYYAITIPANLKKNTIDIVCGAQRSGSGLRGFTVDVLKGSAGNGVIKSLTEDAASDFQLAGVAIPNGETKILLKMSAASQDAMVTSTFYRCGIYFN